MNFVTASIYNRLNSVDSLLSTSVQLSIIHQVNRLVYLKFEDEDRASGSVFVSNAGYIVLGLDAQRVLELSGPYLLQTIDNWNSKSCTNEILLDTKTFELAKLIENEFAHSSDNRTLTQATIAAQLSTDCDKAVLKHGRLVENTVQLLFDQSTGDPIYIGDSGVGRMIHDQIVHSIASNNRGYPDIHIVQAPQGTGKTKLLSKTIERLTSTECRTVFISPRQQLVLSMFDDITQIPSIKPTDILLGTSARSVTKKHQRRPADEYRVTITTINSMEKIWQFGDELLRMEQRLEYKMSHNLISDDEYDREKERINVGSTTGDVFNLVPQQDLVIYDEFQLLRSSIMTGTHIDNNKAFWIRNHMNRLERRSRVVLVLDADIDASAVEYFTLNHPNSKIHVHKFVVPEDRTIHLHADNESLMNWFYDQIESIEPKVPGVVSPAGFAVPCTSVRVGREVEQTIRHLRPDLKVIWIERDNKNDPDQRAILADPSLARQYDVILYSPTIFTGFSFDAMEVDGRIIPIANNVVGIFTGSTINCMERAQSLFRVRNCMEFHFSVSSTKETNKVTHGVLAERLRLFNRDGMRTPTPIHECANDNLIPYFRSRGFQIINHAKIEHANEVVGQMVEEAKKSKVAVPLTSGSTKQSCAQRFIEVLLSSLEVNASDLKTGSHLIFKGRLQDQFSKVVDQMFGVDPTLGNCVRTVLPKWNRNIKMDINLVQKMFEAADGSSSIVVKRTNTRTVANGRHTIYDLTVVVK